MIRDLPPSMGAGDFAWMLRERPGCDVRRCNGGPDGRGSRVVQNPRYDSNDDAPPVGVSYWAAPVEQQPDSRRD